MTDENLEPLDLYAILGDVAVVQRLTFGRPEADRLAHEHAPALIAEIERLHLDLDVARANRENVERDWREAREQVADLRRSFSRAVERTAKRIERMGRTVSTELAAGMVREMVQPVALEAAQDYTPTTDETEAEVRDEPLSRQVTTAAELDALPLATSWICGCGYQGTKAGNDRYVLLSGKILTRGELTHDHLPITLLHTPKETDHA